MKLCGSEKIPNLKAPSGALDASSTSAAVVAGASVVSGAASSTASSSTASPPQATTINAKIEKSTTNFHLAEPL